MSALPPKADMCGAKADVRVGPKTISWPHLPILITCFLVSPVTPKSSDFEPKATASKGQCRTLPVSSRKMRRSLRNLFRCACHVLEERSLEITSSAHLLGLIKEAIGYPRESLLCRGIRR